MLFLLIIMDFNNYTLQFVKIIFVSAYQVEGEEHDWEYHATVFVYITSSHAKHLEKNCHQYLSLYHSPVYNPENTNCRLFYICLCDCVPLEI